MSSNFFSEEEFRKLRDEINQEIKRRSTFKWWDPLFPPTVGEDKTPPLTIPSEIPQEELTDKTYTINTPSDESLEETKNIHFPKIGDNPANTNREDSSVKVEIEEIKNFLVGLSKILDINLYYGRDEDIGLAFRNPEYIKEALDKVRTDKLNKPLHEIDPSGMINDPNGGVTDRLSPDYPHDHPIHYSKEDGKYVMPSGETDGEEGIPNEDNFFDDYKPYNTHVSKPVDRSWYGEGDYRDKVVKRMEGGVRSSKYGMNPRNPNVGKSFRSRPVHQGVPTSCNVACFVAGTMVETPIGPVPIEKIKVTTEVLTKSKNHHMVYEIFQRIKENCIRLDIEGAPGITCTPEHPFWAKVYKGNNQYEEPAWVEAIKLKKEDLVKTLKLSPGKIKILPTEAYRIGWTVAEFSVKSDKDLGINEILSIFMNADSPEITEVISNIYKWNKFAMYKFLEGFIDSKACNVDDTALGSTNKKLMYQIATIMKMINKNYQWTEIGIDDGTLYTIKVLDGNNESEWSKVVNSSNVGFKLVYNMSVADDPTFYADMALVHNCTGLCHVTCDSSCSESCTSTCWNRCGNACTSVCGNVCTSCTTLCRDTCKTHCSSNEGYACIKAGLIPGKKVHTCDGCSYSCRFYPNKSALCTDSACKTLCFNTCVNACARNCMGSCTNNESENTDYTSGIGRGCRSQCTVNCIGSCLGVCVGYCVQTCWSTCKSSCHDNCNQECETQCGFACDTGCTNGCTNTCSGVTGSRPGGCRIEGCTSQCKQSCNTNCVGAGCRSVCGIDGTNSCEANCRMSCVNASCTSLCSDACASQCTTCVQSCGFNCGNYCKDACGYCCDTLCGDSCTMECQLDCTGNCMFTCEDECSSCSNLCYSCISMCIGTCSVRCTQTCSHCTNNCSHWCDTSCNQACAVNCDNYCISTCSGQCMTLLQSETSANLPGMNFTNPNYPRPRNRREELEALKILRRRK